MLGYRGRVSPICAGGMRDAFVSDPIIEANNWPLIKDMPEAETAAPLFFFGFRSSSRLRDTFTPIVLRNFL